MNSILNHVYWSLKKSKLITVITPDRRAGAKGFVIFVYLRRHWSERLRPTSSTFLKQKRIKSSLPLQWYLIITSTSAGSRARHGLQATHRHLQPLHQTRQLSHTCETEKTMKDGANNRKIKHNLRCTRSYGSYKSLFCKGNTGRGMSGEVLVPTWICRFLQNKIVLKMYLIIKYVTIWVCADWPTDAQ